MWGGGRSERHCCPQGRRGVPRRTRISALAPIWMVKLKHPCRPGRVGGASAGTTGGGGTPQAGDTAKTGLNLNQLIEGNSRRQTDGRKDRQTGGGRVPPQEDGPGHTGQTAGTLYLRRVRLLVEQTFARCKKRRGGRRTRDRRERQTFTVGSRK